MATATKKRQRDALGRYVSNTTSIRRRAKKKAVRKTVRKKRAKKKRAKKKTAKPVTHIAFVLDNSGSMFSHRARTQAAFNEIIKPIKALGGDKEQKLRVSYYTFGYNARSVFSEAKAEALQPLKDYNPREGRTALYEAINLAIHNFDRLSDANDDNSSFLIQVVTDGQENKWNVDQQHIQDLIRARQETDRWTFAVSCPERYVGSISQRLGIFEGNVHGWDPSSRLGMDTVSRGQSVGLRTYLGSRATGSTATKAFFAEVNVGRQGIRAVKSGLKAEAAGRFRRLKVDKARSIKDFIESRNLTFQKGRVFYALSKPEIVQSFKEILLQKRDKPSVLYGGAQVRNKLGIPGGQEGKVTPGNLGEWVVWIQSTSSNRKLLAKMEILYDTSSTVKNGRN